MGRWFLTVLVVACAVALVGAGVIVVTSPTLLGARAPAPATPSAAPAEPAAPASSGTVAPSSTASSAAAPSPSQAQEAVDAASATNGRRGVKLAVAVLDRSTGTLAFNAQGDDVENSASLAKLFTIVDMFTHSRSQVTESDLALARRALTMSDDQAMNGLWTRFGGSAGVQRVIDLLGLPDSAVPPDPSQWGQVQVSARDMTTLFAFVYRGLAPADRDFVLDNLTAATPNGRDGFNQSFGLLEPTTRGPAAAKQGWSCCLQGGIDLHSAGVLDREGRYVVALLSHQPVGYEAGRAVLNDAAHAARTALAG